jgi:phosphatidylglycerol lysyltransferase
MFKRLLRKLGPVLSAALFILALLTLYNELKSVHYHEVMQNISLLPRWRIWLAFVLTAASFFCLTLYDALASRYIRRSIDYSKMALASFVSYSFSNTVGYSLLTSAPLRYRFYTVWGLSAVEITKLIGFVFLTYWVGLVSVAGFALVVQPDAITSHFDLPVSALPLGTFFWIVLAAYLLATVFWKKPVRIRGEEVFMPPLHLALGQVVAGCLDWFAAAGVLFVLLPEGNPIGFLPFLGVFVLAQALGGLSNVPGGLGVFETVMLHLLTPAIPPQQVFASLILYRVIYYLIPLALATLLIGIDEVLRRSGYLRGAARAIGQWIPTIVPQVMGLATFVGGALLLVSGATPGEHGRLAWLQDFIPLPVVEISHFLASIAGAGLLVLGRGIQRRLDAAYVMTVLLLTAGIVFSLLKGLDYEEATILAVMLAALLACRSSFYRKSSMFSERFTTGWIISVVAVLVGAAWLTFFAYKRVEYSHDLWWQFAIRANAPRSLRAWAGAISLLMIFALRHLLRPSRKEPDLPTIAELEDVRNVAYHSDSTNAWLAMLGDKALLWNETKTAYIMYAVEGRTYVALGDPIGSESDQADLAWEFRGLCEQRGAWPVFYQIPQKHLPLYIDLGLTLTKLGEEARVPLESFALQGRANKNLRHSYQDAVDDGCTFEIVPAEHVPPLFAELREISDSWLQQKNTREKGFSLGYFDENYLRFFPMALVRVNGRIMAFANVLESHSRAELSIDLMRHREGAPRNIMDYMFVELMLWGKEQNYRWFNLGMAPLSGFQERDLMPLWTRVGAFLFRRGENFYNFQGVRNYKEKFKPVWEPHYLASPGGFALPVIATNLATLISGGLKGVVSK